MIQSDRYLTDKEKEHRAAVQEAERQLPMLDGDAAAEYNALKEQYSNTLIGFELGGYFLFYDKDAITVKEVLRSNLLSQENALGRVKVTGFPTGQWAADAKKLWAEGNSMPELQIIPQEEFEAAQRIREDRSAHAAEEAEHHVPLRTRGQALLSNNVYCGHCGARLALTTSRKWRKLSDGTLDDTLRIRYTCYGKLRKQTDCTGQTGYTMHILDEIIDKMVRQIFSRLRGIPKEQLITSRYAKETAERKNHLQALQAERDKAEKDLLALKTEILAVIKGESAFPKDTLAEMIAAQEKKHTELDTLCEEASAELERNAELMANVSQLYEELISYADLYDSASFEAKKMIVSQLIRRVEVYRGYQIHVDFNFDLAQYLENSDQHLVQLRSHSLH